MLSVSDGYLRFCHLLRAACVHFTVPCGICTYACKAWHIYKCISNTVYNRAIFIGNFISWIFQSDSNQPEVQYILMWIPRSMVCRLSGCTVYRTSSQRNSTDAKTHTVLLGFSTYIPHAGWLSAWNSCPPCSSQLCHCAAFPLPSVSYDFACLCMGVSYVHFRPNKADTTAQNFKFLY